MGIIFIFTGKSAVGKSALIRYIRTKYHFKSIHLRNYLVALMIENEIKDQTLFAKFMETHLPKLVKSLHKSAGCIIEGVYSPQELQLLKSVFSGDNIVHIHVDSLSSVRVRRIMKRHTLSEEDATKKMKSSDEYREKIGWDSLNKRSDIKLVNIGSQRELFESFEKATKNLPKLTRYVKRSIVRRH